jgi:tRNA pseudouridine55 synthase
VTSSGGRVPRPRIAWRDVDGILLLDKPLGLSSNQALQRVRRAFRAAKAGHTGSLDPLATGVLPICLGQATKVSGLLLDDDKTYEARVVLGARTSTGDAEGEVVERLPIPVLGRPEVEAALARFTGEQDQLPPMYSALKRDGRPLYELAREGVEVERATRRIVVHRIALLEFGDGSLTFEVECSKGTYVRTLGEDLARALGTCGHLGTLRRTAVGAFAGLPLQTLEELEAVAADGRPLDDRLLPVDAPLRSWPTITLDAAGARDVLHGRAAACAPVASGAVRIYGPDHRLLGLGTVDASGSRVAPDRLLTSAGPDAYAGA